MIRSIKKYGMEALKALGNNIPCTIVLENVAFGDKLAMTRAAKKVNGEYKQHPCKLTVPITNSFKEEGDGFTTGPASLKSKNLQIGIFSAFIGNEMKPVSFVAVPTDQREQYLKFKTKLTQTAGKLPRLKKNNAWVIGSNTTTTLELKTSIDMVVNDQKQEIIDSIESVFTNPRAYTDMGLQPFRKICFSGEPGTGKTMTASAIAKLMNDKHLIKTMYVSGGGLYGSSFDLIKTALNLIKNHPSPTILIVEEFDSFVMGMDDRAKILTFLDGFETPYLKYPLCLIATTNHPDRIDPAIISRSGRINRTFLFHGIKSMREADTLVNIYRGTLELPDISSLILNKTPDFVKELLVELKWSNENGMEMSLSNISEKIRKLSSGLMYSKCEGVEFG